MVDQMEFLYQGIENARNQYQQQQQQARQQPQQQQPPFNEEVTSFPSPNASDLSHGSAFHPMQLQFQHRASFLNQHFFPFPQPHANFANINMTCQQQTTSPDLSAQLLLQQQLQQQQQQLQLSPQHLTPPLQMSPPLHHQLSQLPQLQHQPQRHHHHDHQPEQQQQQQPQLMHQTPVAQPEPSAHGAKTTGDNHGKRDKKKKTKRVRTTFTPEQLSRLEAEFADQGYLVGEYRNYLAKVLHLSECQVKVWFQNRRIKKRKQEKQAMKAEQ